MVADTSVSPSPLPRKLLTVAEAKQLVDQLTRSSLFLGDKWYIINQNWWVEFQEMKDSGDDAELINLPPISNEEITEKVDDGYQLKPKLVEGFNFTVIPENVFKTLVSSFGVDSEKRDIIQRTVINGTLMQNKPFIEIYLHEIKVANFSNKNEEITIKISQGDSIERIREKIMDALAIPAASRDRTRFITEETDGKFENLPTTISQTRLNALLNSGLTLYVDATGSAVSEQKSDESNGNRRVPTYSSAYLRQPHQPGLCGLQNLGNTCFMNSALQCLSNVPELTEYFRLGKYIEEINESNPLGTGGRLVKSYADVINELWSGNQNSVRPHKLKCVIGEFAPRFNGYSQQDSQELTSFLLDGLHEDVNRIKKKPYIEEKESDGRDDAVVAEEAWIDYKKRNDSIIVDLMHGQLKSTLVCPECTKVSVKFDPFCYLAVPVPAKERQTRSTIVVVRNNKWAKFVLTHTNKTTAGQAIHLIKENLKLEPNIRVVLLSSYSNEVLYEDSVLSPSQYTSYATNKTYYAFVVSEGLLAIVDNRATGAYDRLLGSTPIVTNLTIPPNNEFMRNSVIANVLPAVREFLWKPKEPAAETPDGDIDISSEKEPKTEEILPTEVALTCNNQTLIFSDDAEEGIKINGIPHTPLKITLKWAVSGQFQNVDMTTLVDRELSMPVAKKSYNLQECIDLFTSQEQLDENDTWYCPRCKMHQRAFKKLDLWALPKILIISLKRFQYNRYTRDKIDTEITIQTKGLDLSAKVLDPTHKFHKYDLIGISNHSGGLGSGHYTAKAFNNDTWCEFNDSSAYKVDNHMPESITSREAYILFYRRRDAVSPPRKTRSSTLTVVAPDNAAATNTRNSPGASPSRRRTSESTNKMEVD